jgi:hypothetical protein
LRPNALAWAITAVICGGVPTKAAADEPGADIAGSYAFINAVGYGNDYHKGWLASGAVYVSNIWGVAGEVGGSYSGFDVPGGAPPLRASIYNFMGGPRFMLHGNQDITPFAQVLLGGIRVGNNYGGYVSNFAWQPGGGVDVALRHTIAVRLQGDLRLIQSGGTIKEFRFASGIVFRK